MVCLTWRVALWWSEMAATWRERLTSRIITVVDVTIHHTIKVARDRKVCAGHPSFFLRRL
ncbi:MAG: hypothetical protein K0A99_08340 [Desulfoarculaceae bacterium]|nr:hypothetical protein [Desulfoarculaceae bacterium]